MDKHLLKKLEKYASPFEGTLYRSTSLKYANTKDILSGQGSAKNGGRWNPVGLAAVYGSLTPEAAMAETLAHVRYYGIPAQSVMPRTFVAIHAQLEAVVDISSTRVQKAGGFAASRLAQVDWRAEIAIGKIPAPHALGSMAAELGLEALLVPSAVSEGELNLVCFAGNIAKTSSLTVLSADDLDV